MTDLFRRFSDGTNCQPGTYSYFCCDNPNAPAVDIKYIFHSGSRSLMNESYLPLVMSLCAPLLQRPLGETAVRIQMARPLPFSRSRILSTATVRSTQILTSGLATLKACCKRVGTVSSMRTTPTYSRADPFGNEALEIEALS